MQRRSEPPRKEELDAAQALRTVEQLENELNAQGLELEKCQEQIVELENLIYVVDALQGNRTSNLINDVDKYLKLGQDLGQANLVLRKQLLLETKKQSDIRAEISRLAQSEALEAAEITTESAADLESAKHRMLETVRLLEQEQAILQRDSQEMSLSLAQKPIFPSLEQVLAEIEELLKARQAIAVIASQQAEEYVFDLFYRI